MGVPNSEVGYTSAMPRREDHEVRKGHVGIGLKKKKHQPIMPEQLPYFVSYYTQYLSTINTAFHL